MPNAVQPPAVITMMKANISLIPGITALVSAALIFSLYKLDEPRHEKIRQALQDRREKQEKES